eukprot:4048048-Amphidinium_carterae.1
MFSASTTAKQYRQTTVFVLGFLDDGCKSELRLWELAQESVHSSQSSSSSYQDGQPEKTIFSVANTLKALRMQVPHQYHLCKCHNYFDRSRWCVHDGRRGIGFGLVVGDINGHRL